jgi:hypothetical protein
MPRYFVHATVDHADLRLWASKTMPQVSGMADVCCMKFFVGMQFQNSIGALILLRNAGCCGGDVGLVCRTLVALQLFCNKARALADAATIGVGDCKMFQIAYGTLKKCSA